MSRLFGETLRKPPTDADTVGEGLLLRAGYIRRVAPGIFSYLPLGLRAVHKIATILRAEMNAIGGQEVSLPAIQPARLWRRTGRLERVGEEMVRFSDRAEREMVVGTSHEEVAAELARSDITSYRQLPALLYQIRPTFRDEARPRGGLLRTREFDLMDSYSFDRDPSGLEEQYTGHRDAFKRIFERLELEQVIVAKSQRGEEQEEEFLFLLEAGDQTAVLCDACDHTANLDAASFRKPEPASEAPQALERVATPGTTTIDSLAHYLDIPTERTAKVVFFSAGSASGEAVVMALVRGDMEVSEPKLARAIDAFHLRPAETAAIQAVGAVPGYASPIGLDSQQLIVVVDDLVAASANLVSGANEEGFHYRNVNFERDYRADAVTDITAAHPGAPCPDCGSPLRAAACLEVASLHRFGRARSEALELTFQDKDGRLHPMAVGSYGMGVGRLLGCVAETHHDDQGLRMPASVAPYQVYIVALAGGDEEVADQADALYSSLCQAGLEVLYDERAASGGVKFKDADLLGIPLRITVGQRSLKEGGVEFKRRDADERHLVKMTDAVECALEMLSQPARPTEI